MYITKWKVTILCLLGQVMTPTGQRPLLKDSWCQNLILWEEQLANPTIAYINANPVILGGLFI